MPITPKPSFNCLAWLCILLISSLVSLAIALPSFFLKTTAVEKKNEGEVYVRSFNRAQMACFTENSHFVSKIDVLIDFVGAPIKTETNYFRYSTYIDGSRKTIKNLAYPHIAIQIGQSTKPERKSFVGAVWLSQVAGTTDVTSLSIVCEASTPSLSIPPVPIVKAEGMMECAPGTQFVGN